MKSPTSRPTLRQTAWHEAGHAIVAWDQGFTVVIVSIKSDGQSLGRCTHMPAGNCAIQADRIREHAVAMGGWAAELLSGEAGDGTYDSGDMQHVLSCLDQHAPGQMAAELGWAESEAHRIVSANLERVKRLANALIDKHELSDAAEILAIIEGRLPG